MLIREFPSPRCCLIDVSQAMSADSLPPCCRDVVPDDFRRESLEPTVQMINTLLSTAGLANEVIASIWDLLRVELDLRQCEIFA